MRVTRRTLSLCVLTMLVLGFCIGHVDAASRQSKSFVYQRMDVDLRLQQDGTLNVTERLTMRYSGGPFSSASREIPFKRLDAIEAITVREAATAYQENSPQENTDQRTPATFQITRDPQKVAIKWFYPPTSDSERTFTLNYRVRGVVRVGREEDELWWVAIFPDRNVPVEHSRVTLTLPEAAHPSTNDVSIPLGDLGKLAIEQNVISITHDDWLPPNMQVDMRVRLPSDLITSAEPQWQGSTNPVDSAAPTSSSNGILYIGVVAGITGAFFLLNSLIQRKRKRNQRSPGFVAPSQSNTGSSSSGFVAPSQSNTSSSWSGSSNSSSDSSWSSSSDSSWSSSSDSSWSSSSDSSSSDSGGSGGGGGNAD
jgi:hypothetical protein